MKLLFDFRAYQHYHGRGIGRYVYELFSRVMELNRDGVNSILAVTDDLAPPLPEDLRDRAEIICAEEVGHREVRYDVFLNGSTVQLWFGGYHALATLYPRSVWEKARYKTCILYDFVPLLYAHYRPTRRDEINYLLQCEAVRYMDHVFTISEYVKMSGMKYLHRPAEDFTNLYGGADPTRFHSERSGKSYTRSGRNHDLVYVSAACPRKNYQGVTEAFGKAYRAGRIPGDARLVLLCGTQPFFEKEVRESARKYRLKIGKQIVMTGFIPDAEMVAMIADATCSIFPSYYEGLGLPILESYAIGTPCIASNTSSMREMVPEEASFDPFDTEEMSRKIIQIYHDDALLVRSLHFGQELLKWMTWENSAERMYRKLGEMVGGSCSKYAR